MGERLYATMTWEGEPVRAEKRIKRNIEKVLLLCYDGLDLVRISNMPGAPGLRTMRRWVSENLYGFGRKYHLLMRQRAIDRLAAGIEADYRRIRVRAERNRKRTGQRDRTE